MQPRFTFNHLTLAFLAISAPQVSFGAEADANTVQLQDTYVLGTAEEELKQAPGVSIITAEDIKKQPPRKQK